MPPFTAALPAIAPALLDFIDTRDATQLRLCSVEYRDAVAAHPWADTNTPVLDMDAWRACFPRARGAAVTGALAHAEAVMAPPAAHSLSLACCTSAGLNEAWAARHLGGRRLVSLRLPGCELAPDVLAALAGSGVQEVDLLGCRLRSRHLTEADLAHVASATSLRLARCLGARLGAGAFKALTRLVKLDVTACGGVTDAAFRGGHLPALRVLDVSLCPRLTDAALAELGGLTSLTMQACPGITLDAVAARLPRLTHLDISHHPPSLTADAMRRLSPALAELVAVGVRLADRDVRALFEREGRAETLRVLDVSECHGWTDAVVPLLGGLRELRMARCYQREVTAGGLEPLVGRVARVDVTGCSQLPITLHRRLYSANM